MSLTLTRRHNVDRFGYLIPTRYGNVPMVGAVATYRPGEGRFCGAVAVEEGTTNLWTNPGWLDGTLSGWSNYSSSGGTGIREVVRDARFGCALRLAKTDSGVNGRWGVYQNKTWHQTGSVIADSVYVKVISASNGAMLRCYSDYLNSGGSPYYERGWALNLNTFELYPLIQGTARHLTITPVGDGWYRIEFVTVEGDIVSGTSYYWIDGAPAEVLLAYPQKEAKPFATSFVDGTRAAGVLRYPQLLDKKCGTLSVWINPHVVVSWNNFFLMNLSTGRFLLFFYADGSSRWDFGPSNSGPRAPAGTIVAGQWTMHTLTWDADAGVYRYYVNGEFVGEHQYVEPDSLPSALPTVTNYGALLDELLILPYAASEEEIRAWYEADGPIPPHPAALLQWDWQAVRPATMVAL